MYIVPGIGYCDEDDFETCEYCGDLFSIDELELLYPGFGVCEKCFMEEE